ncbi:hypothetical protein V8C35DRAFT_276391 [Trichoderma chlorosporum]
MVSSTAIKLLFFFAFSFNIYLRTLQANIDIFPSVNIDIFIVVNLLRAAAVE